MVGFTLLLSLAVPPPARSGAEALRWEDLNVLPENTQIEYPVTRSEAEWKKLLSPARYKILRGKGTERAFTGQYDEFYEKGTYYSAATGQPLFSSEAKFKSGTGWPSFYAPVDPEALVLREDNSWFTRRVEVLDSSSGSHLGHVFNDGPGPTGLRYCLNSASLIFVPEGAEPPRLVRDYLARHGE